MQIGPVGQPTTPEEKKFQKACKDFEAVFIRQMLNEMQTQSKALLGGSSADQTYREMLYDELSKRISAGPGMGVADVLYRQLKDQVQGGNHVDR